MDFKKKPQVKRVQNNKKVSKNISEKSEEKMLALNFNPQDFSKQIEVAEKIVVGHAKKFVFEKFPNLRNVKNLVFVWLFLMGGLLLSVAGFRIFGQSAYKESKFVDGGIYSEGILGEIKTLNPLFATTEPEKAFSELAFSRLFNLDSSGELNTELAESVSTSDNYKNFTVKIRNNVLWSDGEKLTANDVIFTTELLKSRIVNPSGYSSWSEVKVSKKSDFEVDFSMPTASKLVLYSLNFAILPAHKFDGVAVDRIRENSFSRSPITSGKFSFESLNNNGEKSKILMKRNEKYFAGASKLAKFELVAFSNLEDVENAVSSGEISGSPSVKLADFSANKKQNLEENQSELNRATYAFLNNSNGVFKDKSLRQAVQKGVDVSKINSKMYAVSKMSFPALNEDLISEKLEVPQNNFNEAVKTLEELGWKLDGKVRKKDGQNLRVFLTTVSESNLENAAKELKNQLEKLGFEVQLSVADKNDKSGNYLQSVIQPRNYDILLYEIDFGADSSDIYAFWHSSQANSSGLNFSNYSDAISNDLLLNARRADSSEKQREILTSFSKRWLDQAPAIAISRSKMTYVHRKSVKSYSVKNKLVGSLQRYADVQYWQVDKSALYKTP